MFDFLGTFTKDQFKVFNEFLSTIDGGLPSLGERKKHIQAEMGRFQEVQILLRAIDSRRMAGSQKRWKEEPHIPEGDELMRPARCDQEPSLFISSMKWIFHKFLWHKKDEAAYNWLKVKDRIWQFEEEIRDIDEVILKWPRWVERVSMMLAAANLEKKIHRNLLHTNDHDFQSPPRY